jgi:HAD superfamily hydrolase (TIGR01509 family)
LSETFAAGTRLERVRTLIVQARALIFDVDGTLAETEEAHRQAFNAAFVETGLDWCWEHASYKELLQVTGGKERIRAFASLQGGKLPLLSNAEIDKLHLLKSGLYAKLVANGGCPLRPGVRALLAAARSRGQRLAIATTTSRDNIDVLLTAALGEDWAQSFAAIVAGDEVPVKKPSPAVYLEVLSQLNLPASQCLAIEDSSNGLVAASGAGIPVLILRSAYFQDDSFPGALLAVDDLTEVTGP